jgi:hypothetical protein
MTVKYPDVTAKLLGENGNAFVLIGLTATAIRRGVGNQEAKDFADEAMSQTSYDELLAFIQRTVNVI